MNLPQDDPVKGQPDITLAEKVLNWSASIDLDEGLRKTINYFSNTEKN